MKKIDKETKQNKGRAGESAFRRIYPLLLALCLAAAAVCSYGLLKELYGRERGRSYYAGAASKAKAAPKKAGAASVPGGPGRASEMSWAPYVDFDASREGIPGLTAWIRCEGTVIDYPVVQGDDNEYYLGHLPNGSKNKMGSIFLDFRCPPDFTGKTSILYGHHMKNGDMFTALESFRSQSFYEEHPVFELYTPEKDYLAELIAGYVIDADRETLPLRFESDAGFERYVGEIRRRSFFKSGAEVLAGDRLVIMATCSYDSSNARFVLVGKLKPVARGE